MFLQWEAASRDCIKVKRCYVDLTGDLTSAILLSQIIYWFLPDKKGEQRTTIIRDGRRWIAKRHDDWWGDCRIPSRTVKRHLAELEAKHLITTAVWRFDGDPVTHISVNFDNLVTALEAQFSEKRSGQNGPNQSTQTGLFVQANLARTNKEAEITAETTKEKQRFSLPSWVPKEAWDGYEEMRKVIKYPLTDRARVLAVKELENLRSQGYDPAAVLNRSVLNNWRGLFPLNNNNGKATTPWQSPEPQYELASERLKRFEQGAGR